MTFTAQERQQAQQFAPVAHIHIGGNFNGGQLMVSSPGGQQQQTLTGEQKEAALAALLPWLAQVIAQGQLQREACAELQAELDTLKAQAASPNPKWPVIGAVAGSVRTILEGAGGGMLAAQALGWLPKLDIERDWMSPLQHCNPNGPHRVQWRLPFRSGSPDVRPYP